MKSFSTFKQCWRLVANLKCDIFNSGQYEEGVLSTRCEDSLRYPGEWQRRRSWRRSDEEKEEDSDEDEWSTEILAIEEEPLRKHLNCTSHTLILVCTSDLNKLDDSKYKKLSYSALGKCSKLWNMSGRPKSSELNEKALGCKLKLPCVTR